MANTYSWTINSFEVRPTQESLTDVVYKIHWCYKAVSDQTDENGDAYDATSIGTHSINGVDPVNFTAFGDLTQSIVEGWLEQDINMDSMKSYLDGLIDEKITPTSKVKTAPW
jgi:hypothetical protein